MLTLQKLKDMDPNTIFATGTAMDSEYELYMTGSGKKLRWVAVRGRMHDWTIYCHFAIMTIEWVRRNGDKVIMESHIKRLVMCDKETFEMYRY